MKRGANKKSQKSEKPVELRPGMWARQRGVGRPGEILKINAARGQAEVRIGGITWTMKLAELEASEPDPHAGAPARSSLSLAPSDAESTYVLDLHGMRAEEACEVLDKFVDAALASGLNMIKIIHGHGTGTLRKAVRDYLARHPHVREFHFGSPAQGGLAVTMAFFRG